MFIINYHNIVSNSDYDQYDKSIFTRKKRRAFEEEVELLSKKFHFVSLKEVVKSLKERQVIPNALTFTFDDAYRGVYEFALPVLEAYGTIGSIFVISQYSAGANYFDFDKLEIAFRLSGKGSADELKRTKEKLKNMPRSLMENHFSALLSRLGVTEDSINQYASANAKYHPLSWQEINDAFRRGHIIGSHSKTHHSLTQMSIPEAIEEIRGSLSMIRKSVSGLSWIPFAYPYGKQEHFSEYIADIVKESGYTCALTALSGENTPYTSLYKLRRVELEAGKFI